MRAPESSALGRMAVALVLGGLLILPLVSLLELRDERGGGLLDVLGQGSLQELLGNSILLGCATVVLATILALPLALLLNLVEFPGRRGIGWCYFLPLLIPPHVHAISWMRVLGDQGWMTRTLRETLGVSLNIRAPVFELIYWGPALIMASATFPFIALAVSAGFRSLDGHALEAARLLGGSRQSFARVLWPQLFPRVSAGVLFVFVMAISTFPVVSLLNTPVLISKVFSTFSQIDQGAGVLMAAPLVGVVGALVVGLGFLDKPSPSDGSGLTPIVRRRGSWWHLALACLPLIFGSGVPIASLVYDAGPLRFDGRPDNYQSVFARVDSAFPDSLMLAGMGVAALLLVGYPLARAISRNGPRVLEVAALAGLAMPPAVIGAALVAFWSKSSVGAHDPIFVILSALAFVLATMIGSRSWRAAARSLALALGGLLGLYVLMDALGLARWIYERRVALVVFAYVARFLPFVVRVLRAGFLQLDRSEDEVARLAGHGRWSRWRRVELPRVGGTVAAAALMGYVLCITELAATILVIPPGWQSVQRRIFNMVHFRSVGEVAALCVLSIVLTAVPVFFALILARKKVDIL